MSFDNIRWADAARTILRADKDGAAIFIPDDPANADRAAVAAWEAAGHRIAPFVDDAAVQNLSKGNAS